MLVRGVRAIAYRSQAVKRRYTESRGEIAVRAATRDAFSDRQAHLRRQRFSASEKRGADFAFHGGAIEAAANFQARSTRKRPQRAQAFLDAAHVRKVQRAKIDDRASTFGDDIDARSALDNVGVHADAAAQVVR